MDIRSEKRNRFSHHQVHSIVGNFRVRSKRKAFKKKRRPLSWGNAATRAYLRMKSIMANEAKSKRSKKDLPGWTYTRFDAEIKMQKTVYNFKKSWLTRMYEVLEWINQKEHRENPEKDSLWQVSCYYETSKLNMMKRNHYQRQPFEHRVRRWSEVAHDCYRILTYRGKGQLANRDYSDWDWCFRVIEREFTAKRKGGWHLQVRSEVFRAARFSR